MAFYIVLPIPITLLSLLIPGMKDGTYLHSRK